MKNAFTIALFGTMLSLSSPLSTVAQQDASFSQYFFSPLYVNPAYAGSRETFSGTLVHRSQWVRMPGAPITQALGVHSPIANTNIGLGLQIYNDKAGPMRNTGFSGIFAYHLKLDDVTRLSLGVAGMVNNIGLNSGNIEVEDQADPAFASETRTSWVPDADVGAYLYRRNFYAGFSVRHLVQSRFRLPNANGGMGSAHFDRHYYLVAGMVTPLTTNFALRPSILLKYVGDVPFVLDLNASLIYRQRFFFGLGWRTGAGAGVQGTDNVLIGSLEYDFPSGLRAGYSYDYFINKMGSYNSGTHEIMVGWDLSFAKTRMTSPRYF